MSNYNLLFFFLLLVSIFYGIETLPRNKKLSPRSLNNNNNKNGTDDTCNRNKIDQCMLELAMIGDPNWRFPENIQAMNQRCRRVRPLEQCIKSFSEKCLQSDTRQTIMVMMYGISKLNKQYCSSQRRKSDFINSGKCANKFLKEINAYMVDLLKAFHAIRFYPDNKMKFPLTCCNYYKYKDRVLAKFEKHCQPDQKLEYEHLLDGYASDTLNLICGEFDSESDKCSTIIHKTPEWKKSLDYKSYVLPLVDIMDSIK